MTQFVDGLIAKKPHENAPDFVKAGLSIKREELIKWLEAREDEWINLDVKEGKSGKWYASVNEYKKDGWQEKRQEVAQKLESDEVALEDLPF